APGGSRSSPGAWPVWATPPSASPAGSPCPGPEPPLWTMPGEEASPVSVLSRLLRPLANLVLSLVVVVGIWLAFLAVFAVDPLVAKSPVAVWHYLSGGTEAGAHRRLVLRALNQTLLDAGLGFVAGLAAALLVALAFVLARAVEQAMMPVAVVLRSVPLVAM